MREQKILCLVRHLEVTSILSTLFLRTKLSYLSSRTTRLFRSRHPTSKAEASSNHRADASHRINSSDTQLISPYRSLPLQKPPRSIPLTSHAPSTPPAPNPPPNLHPANSSTGHGIRLHAHVQNTSRRRQILVRRPSCPRNLRRATKH